MVDDYRLYRWQAQAFEVWKAAKHEAIVSYDGVWDTEQGRFVKTPRYKTVQGGTVAIVTGGGKTSLGLMTTFDWLRGGSGRCVVIVVPTRRLMYQWRDELKDKGVVDIGLRGDGHRARDSHAVIIGIVDSVRTWKQGVRTDVERLLIVDECHRLGSEKNSKVPMLIPHDAILGLSATPKRTDGRDVERLTGRIIYRLDYREGLDDGIIPSFMLRAVTSPLTFGERWDYNDLTKNIAAMHHQLSEWFGSGANFFGIPETQHDLLGPFKAVCAQRKRLVNSGQYRKRLLDHLLAKHANDKVLVFHESVSDLNVMFNRYKQAYDPAMYHYEMSDNEEQFDRWIRGDTNVLLSCRALNEGMNAPECDVAIMLSGTNGVRSRIQTLGRALRGENALIYLVYAPNTTDTKGLGRLVGEGGVPKKLVRHFAWDNSEFKEAATPQWFLGAKEPVKVKRKDTPVADRLFSRENGSIVLPTLGEALGVLPKFATVQTVGVSIPPVIMEGD